MIARFSLLPSAKLVPATTILPSACTAAALAASVTVPKRTQKLPLSIMSSPWNDGSVSPLGSSRVSMKHRAELPYPASTIFPSGCTTTASAASTPPK